MFSEFFLSFMSFFWHFSLPNKTIPLYLSLIYRFIGDAIKKSYSFNNNTTMTKADLVKKIAEGAGITSAEAKKALEATTEAIKDALVKGEKLQLIGFGTFSVNERPAREGKNPRTGEALHIEAKKVAKFKAGAELDSAINA